MTTDTPPAVAELTPELTDLLSRLPRPMRAIVLEAESSTDAELLTWMAATAGPAPIPVRVADDSGSVARNTGA